jgi:UDP-N-acetylmuramyl tripeptide synthase
MYNTHAAALALSEIGLNKTNIEDAFKGFKPAFGRQEVIEYKGKNVQIFLSKNPTSFNQSYETILNLKAKTLLLVLNDRIPDGRDVSWIWDVDLPNIDNLKQIIISGDRVYDMALRVKYEAYERFKTYENLTDAVNAGAESLHETETLYILPTYSAMLEVRKILTGKKIL